MDEKWQEAVRNFELAGNLPEAWLNAGDNLRVAISLLEPHLTTYPARDSDLRQEPAVRLLGPVLMLRGCEVECLLKALYVTRGHRLVGHGRLTPPKGKAHDLVALAHAAGLPIDTDETALLRYLGSFIESGRYPISTRPRLRSPPRGDGLVREAVWSDADEHDYALFIERIRQEVPRLARGLPERSTGNQIEP